MPERFSGELLTMGRYTNLCTFTFREEQRALLNLVDHHLEHERRTGFSQLRIENSAKKMPNVVLNISLFT